MLRRIWMPTIAVVALLGVAGCRADPEGWTPVLEQTSTTFLETQTERALERTRAARGMLPGQPERAMENLDQASGTLEDLLEYYLPILKARELAYNAYRELYLGRPGESIRALDEVESILLEVATVDARFERAVREPLAHTETAKRALETDSSEARQALVVLASELNFMVLKGDLVLTKE